MKDKNWSIHIEFAVLLITLIGGFYTLDNKIERQAQNMVMISQAQTQRTDKLYEMFYEVVRENKKG